MLLSHIDLHTHTTRSDGVLTPEELVKKAEQAHIRLLAITDHNTATDIRALQQAHPAIHLVQGSEISCMYTASDGTDHEIHVVALGFNPNHPAMEELFRQNRPDRRPYINAILAKLEALGIRVGTYEDLEAASGGSAHFGRMVIAQLMVQKGYVESVSQAFDLYLGAHGQARAYVPNPLRYVHMEDAVKAILAAGGIPVLAHLYYYRLSDPENQRLVRYFRHLAGVWAAMEVEYGLYTDDQRRALGAMADEWGLMHSCGSDFHGQDPEEHLDHHFEAWECDALVSWLLKGRKTS